MNFPATPNPSFQGGRQAALAGPLRRRLNSNLKRQEDYFVLTYILIGYIGIGVLLGIKHISKGTYGAKGPIATFVAWALLWPVFLWLSRR